MTLDEAKELLNNLIGMIEDNHNADYDTALKMGIKALEQTRWIPISERFLYCPYCGVKMEVRNDE